MGFVDSITKGLKGHFDKRKEEREVLEKLRRETAMQERILFEQEFKKNALEVAKARAKKEAAKLSGLQKLRAINRMRRLETGEQEQGFLSKLSEYTKKNMAKRDENLQRTAEVRNAAKQMKDERLAKTKGLREQKLAEHGPRKPFSGGGFR